MIKRITAVLFLVFGLAIVGEAQVVTPPSVNPVTQQWSVYTSVVALPGGKSSLAGTDSGVVFTPSANFDLGDRNLLSTDGILEYYAGYADYRFPGISVSCNNMATNLNCLRLRFGITGSFGVARVSGINHYGFTAGAPVDYSLTQSGSWTVGGKFEYLHFPGYPAKALIELNSAFHFPTPSQATAARTRQQGIYVPRF